MSGYKIFSSLQAGGRGVAGWRWWGEGAQRLSSLPGPSPPMPELVDIVAAAMESHPALGVKKLVTLIKQE